MPKPVKPVHRKVRLPTEDTPVTLQSIQSMTEYLERRLRFIKGLLPKMTMQQMLKLDNGLNTILRDSVTLDPPPDDPSFKKKPPQEGPSKKWTPEMIFLLSVYPHLHEDYDGLLLSEIGTKTWKELHVTYDVWNNIMIDVVTSTKRKLPADNAAVSSYDENQTVEQLFQALAALKVFRGMTGPIRR